MRKGRFREDLFFRLNVITMKIPPLQERREDIPMLVDHFLRGYARENRKKVEGISRKAKDLLMKYDYPGNVRELENIMERAVVICRGSLISTEDLPFKSQELKHAPVADEKERTLRRNIETLERELIEEALEAAGGNQTHAAAALGLSERMLRYKLKKYRLK